jgi:hypothetical protein
MKIKRTSNKNPLAGLSKKKVNVGWFESSKYKDGTSVASVAYKNEFGDMGNNQPPRPFFRIAINESTNRWSKTAERVSKDIIKGSSIETSLKFLGVVIQADVQKSIVQITAPALSKKTVELRKEKVAKGRKIANTISKPLIDTGYMLSTLTSEVK